MMDDLCYAMFAVGIIVGIFIGGLGGLSIGSDITYDDIMKQAYDRGHAVQCLGKEGYYWECEE